MAKRCRKWVQNGRFKGVPRGGTNAPGHLIEAVPDSFPDVDRFFHDFGTILGPIVGRVLPALTFRVHID